MTRPEVPDDVVDRLRAICLALPEAHEEQAWVGTRWRIRTKTFAHVLGISDEYPPAYARDAPLVGDATVLTFRADGEELHALVNSGLPFYKPRWNPRSSRCSWRRTPTGTRSGSCSPRATACWRRRNWPLWFLDQVP